MKLRSIQPLAAAILVVFPNWLRADPGEDAPAGADAAGAAVDAGADANADDGDYIRFLEEEARARLQTAVARFENADGVKVDLIGAVHIADRGYFEKLNETFTGYEALLYEMVGSPGSDEDAAAGGASANALRFFQNLMKKMLALEFQLDGIDYTPANFVHADMDWDTFTRMRKERGENLLGMVMKSWKFQAEQAAKGKLNQSFDLGAMIAVLMSNDSSTAMKLVFGRQFHDVEAMISGMEGDEGSVIVAERNKVALGVLGERIKMGEKRIGIFYGAAHLDDMARRLTTDMGFRAIGTDWNTAWDIDKSTLKWPSAEQPAPPAPESAPEPQGDGEEEADEAA